MVMGTPPSLHVDTYGVLGVTGPSLSQEPCIMVREPERSYSDGVKKTKDEVNFIANALFVIFIFFPLHFSNHNHYIHY